MGFGDALGFNKLNEGNYAGWKEEMVGYLKMHLLWKITSGASLRPAVSVSSAPAASPAAGTTAVAAVVSTDSSAQDAWTIKLRKRPGAILRAVESSQRGLISHLGDPKAMWDTLAAHFEQKQPATRFASYEALLSVQKQDDEDAAPALSMRMEKLLKAAQNARSTDFSLQQLDEDLACMALIRALPAKDYSSFRSLLLMKENITLASLKDTLFLEEANRNRKSSYVDSAAALAAYSPSPLSSSTSSTPCTFCDIPGHTEANCFKKATAVAAAKAQTATRKAGGTLGEEEASREPTRLSRVPLLLQLLLRRRLDHPPPPLQTVLSLPKCKSSTSFSALCAI